MPVTVVTGIGPQVRGRCGPCPYRPGCQGSSKGRSMPLSAAAQPQRLSRSRTATVCRTRSFRRSTFAPKTRKTSSWETPSPRSTPAVVVGDEGDGGVAEGEFAREDGFRVSGHVDQRPAGRRVPLGLRPGGEAGPLDDHHHAAVVNVGSGLARGLEHGRSPRGAVRVGEGDVGGAVVVVRLGTARGPVDELVGKDHAAGAEGAAQRTDGAGGEDLPYPQ